MDDSLILDPFAQHWIIKSVHSSNPLLIGFFPFVKYLFLSCNILD